MALNKLVENPINDFRLVISIAQLHTICGTRDISNFIKAQQSNYASHVVRMSYERSLKQLMFNDDLYTKRPARTLIDQVIHDRNISLDEFCSFSINRK